MSSEKPNSSETQPKDSSSSSTPDKSPSPLPSPSPTLSNLNPDEDPDFNHPGEPPLKELFNKTRIHPFKWSTHWKLILYFPFGIVLGCFRFVFSFLIAIPMLTIFNFADMEWLFWQIFGKIFNFWSYVRNPDMLALPEDAPIICCNHTTDFDGMLLFKNIIII